MTPGEQIAKEIRELINLSSLTCDYEINREKIAMTEFRIAELIDKALEK
jgi:hypothetical protein